MLSLQSRVAAVGRKTTIFKKKNLKTEERKANWQYASMFEVS
jgi:hypothetical protein